MREATMAGALGRMSLTLLNIAGAAALLIWAVRLVRTGVERAFSVPLRRFLRKSGDSRALAALSGAGAALALQSATAVAVLATGFVAAGTLAPVTGLAILLGADVGSAAITQLLVLKPAWLPPLLLLTGVAIFMRGRRRTMRQTGRILIGLGLVFISLSMIREAAAPIRESAVMMEAIEALSRDSIALFALAAVFTWLVHSSVAAVLLIVTLAGQGAIGVEAAGAMILGANLGGAFIAWPLTAGAPLPARRVVLGNLALRGGGALIALMLAPHVLPFLGPTPERAALNLHLAFNGVLALLAIPLAGATLGLVARLMPDPVEGAALERASALDESALDQPARALACARREILRLGEEVEAMLRAIMPLYARWDEAAAQGIREKGKEVARMHMGVKLYLARLQKAHPQDEALAEKALTLTRLSTHLESAANTIAWKLLPLAERLHAKGLRFSAEGLEEITDFHDRVLSNARRALDLLITDDPGAARALVEEKARVRAHEEALERSHIERLRRGQSESIDTSNIHQETLRELKAINSDFVMLAYPILAGTGDLLDTRLRGAETS
ncbi:phosphate:Na+ symporter [Meinhardsimonia xiamenensis]|jgi:phosphate:Na+ symporter|uniref:Phosphate:Na+ symporter n=1 Tax=Meinhardsimonia xiamenensis TaxID=990712 RepID=A0A1G8Y712_9RHOB|nr:Na/Pi cotransporter family protein [Meinhardsimonia xiamenensis]PRX37190.1 phosphate:Na+ symporter [Meinhardsimonia xiamenensis]SDJ98602.1 phosphate:Na+ symporter [Meinhardsimonia xiamenensis]